ncbi:hypothetical protein Pmani_025848 [Petrolisthes manimaculis]|uniref:Uncharacterized protein n=1 Tax=Petrolisthes manimaculis TaxID=1843537 RepID=A0AAE1U0R7_9EUCA|nr:hypothetical protein Pmani_025848 [Petrolisthes manimaculis]
MESNIRVTKTLDLFFIDGDDDNEHNIFTTPVRNTDRELKDLDNINSMHVTDEKERDRTIAPLSRIL